MDYVFRLADGRRVTLWSERNQIIRQLSGGGGNRSHISLRTDFLSDLTAASFDGRIYYVYQNTSRRVILSLPDGEEDRMLFGESIESCRHSGLTLAENQGQLYLFYTAWSPIRERYALNVCKPLAWISRDETVTGGEIQTVSLARDEETAPVFQVVSGQQELWVICDQRSFRLSWGDNGEEIWQEGSWIDAAKLDSYKQKLREVDQLSDRIRTYTEEIQRLSEEYEKKSCEFEEEIQRMRTLIQQSEGENLELRTQSQQLREMNLQAQKDYSQIMVKKQEAEQQAEAGRVQLQAAVTQYNELAQVARQLQIEGKKWRDMYYQETKKKRVRPPGAD